MEEGGGEEREEKGEEREGEGGSVINEDGERREEKRVELTLSPSHKNTIASPKLSPFKSQHSPLQHPHLILVRTDRIGYLQIPTIVRIRERDHMEPVGGRDVTCGFINDLGVDVREEERGRKEC